MMLFPILLTTLSAFNSDAPPVKWSFTAAPVPGGMFEVVLTANVAEGWHIYATKLESDLGPIPTTIRFTPSGSFVPVGEYTEPVAEKVFDPNFAMNLAYHSGSPSFVQRFKPATVAAITIKGEVEFMVCNDKTCLPPEVVTFSVDLPPADAKH